MRLKLCSGLLIVSFLLSVSPVWAGVYKWRDDAGKLHFTDDKSRIPLKYRAPGRVEQLRGMIEPPAPIKAEEPPVEGVKDPNAVAEPGQTAQTGPPAGAGQAEEVVDEALLKTIQETKDFLAKDNKRHQRLIEFVKPDVLNGRLYVADVLKNISAKETMIKKLEGLDLPSLQEVQLFLKNSLVKDKEEQIGGEGYAGRVVRLKARMVKNIEIKKKFITRLEADLVTIVAGASGPPQ